MRPSLWVSLRFIFFAGTILATVAVVAGSEYDVHVETTTVQPLSYGGSEPVGKVADLVEDGEYLYVVDTEAHQVLVFGEEELVRTIGGIGNGPGELYYPSGAAVVAEDGRLYVKDNGNRRIQILDMEGRYYGEVESWNTWGMAAARDRLYVGRPLHGKLIASYDGDGRPLDPMGDLLSPAEVIGLPSSEDSYAVYNRALNRIHLAVDNTGTVWVAFQHVPLLRRYSAAGELLLEKRIVLPATDALARSVRDPDSKPPWASSFNMDGVQLTVVLRDIVYDRWSNTVKVLLGDNSVASFDLDGQVQYILELKGQKHTLTTLSPVPGGRSLAVSSVTNSSILVTGTGKH